MDLAVGVIIGGAFGKIIDSVVNDMVMPLVGVIVGNVDFSNMYVVLKGEVAPGASLAAARETAGATVLAYGNFITVAINFVLLAFVVFMLVKTMNRLRKEKVEEPVAVVAPEPTNEEKLLMEIRDALKNR